MASSSWTRTADVHEALPIVECIYQDVWFDPDTSEPPWPPNYVVHAVGFLVRDEENVLSLASEITQDGGYKAVTHVPRKLVVSCRELRHEVQAGGEEE
jgi:hypothetical protein